MLITITAAVHEDHCDTRQICSQNGMVRSVNYICIQGLAVQCSDYCDYTKCSLSVFLSDLLVT